MNRVIAYCRYSSDNQREESIDAQLRAIRDYCKRNDYMLAKTYIDEAKSATSDRRPQFQQIFIDIKNEDYDFLIVHKLDRFARNRYDSAVYKKKLKERGVRLKSVLEDLDDSPESIILESVLEGMSEYYSENLSREVKKGQMENAYQCLHVGGTPPLGYTVDKDLHYQIDKTEALVVKEIYEMYACDKSYVDMANILNARGIKSKVGRSFTKYSFHDLLKNEKYKGVYVFNKSSAKGGDGKRNNHKQKNENDIIKIDGGIPAIVDTELWERVNMKLQSNKRRNAAKKAKQNYLLSGLIVCGECGSPMSGNTRYSGRNKDMYSTYECNARKREKSCSAKGVNKNFIEQIVIDYLANDFFTEENVLDVTKKLKIHADKFSVENNIEIPVLKSELKELKCKMQNIINAVCDGNSNNWMIEQGNQIDERIKYVDGKIKYLEKMQKSTEITAEQIRNYIMKDSNIIELSPDKQKSVIQAYVDKVLVFHNSVEVHLYIDAFTCKIVDKNGGDEESRTPVRKHFHMIFSERSR